MSGVCNQTVQSVIIARLLDSHHTAMCVSKQACEALDETYMVCKIYKEHVPNGDVKVKGRCGTVFLDLTTQTICVSYC